MAEFQPWPKIVRAEKVIWHATEKIDGTNAQILVHPRSEGGDLTKAVSTVAGGPEGKVDVYVGSRKRWVTPGDDNFGFASWVYNHASELVELLGVGRHYGEWWGLGVQRGYGLETKAFSLFNTHRHELVDAEVGGVPVKPTPVLAVHGDMAAARRIALSELLRSGSVVAPGFDKPEGAMLYSPALDRYVKAPFDRAPKGEDS